MATHLDGQVAAFRFRPLDAGPYTFVWVDALTVKVREAGRVVNVHALVATGVNADGHREILGLDVRAVTGVGPVDQQPAASLTARTDAVELQTITDTGAFPPALRVDRAT